MGRTPDRTPGVEDQEGTLYERTVLATAPGEMRFDDASGRFSCRDDLGEFDPRIGGVGLDPNKLLTIRSSCLVTVERSTGNVVQRR